MRLNNDDEDGAAEDEPMLSPSSRSEVHGTIEIDDGPPARFDSSRRPKSPGSQSAIVRWARGNFRLIYIILAILILLGLAILVVAIFLIVRVKGMNEKYQDASDNARDQFRRLYEQVVTFRTGRHGTFKDTNAINFTLTPEQLAQAKAFGLIPDSGGQLAPGLANMEPIKPIMVNISHQRDDPSTTIMYDRFVPDQNFIPPWANQPCDKKCAKQDYAGTPPLLVISLDGFAREYLDRKLVPSLDLLTKCGARADYVFPSYPSKTFPNHYTIATGLYPEAHGIVDNAAFDPMLSPNLEDMKKTKFAKFYGGEPIWSQAVRHGKKMFCLFWPGCSFNITGHNPTMDLPYNRSLQYSQRVDMVVNWLQAPANERPSMIMAYFDQPDYIGHFHTTDDQVNLELQYIESVLNYFFTSLHTNGLLECVNIIILSDHGMQFLHKKIYVDEVIDSKGMIVATGVVGRIHLANSTKTVEEVMDKFSCPADKSYRVFDRPTTPKRYHYAKTPRVGDVILDGQKGTTFYPTKLSDYGVTSDHGYDYLDPQMHAIFFAHGPNIQPHIQLPAFQNIEVFNLFVDLLGLPHEVPNNGTYGIFKPLLRDLNPIYPPKSLTLQPIGLCQTPNFLRKNDLDNCMNESQICGAKKHTINAGLDSCQIHQPPLSFFHSEIMQFCLIDACSISIIDTVGFRNGYDDGKPIAIFETFNSQEAELAENNQKNGNQSDNDCEFLLGKFESECGHVPSKPGLQRISILANFNNDFKYLKRTKYEFFDGFVNGPFDYLQNLTLQYAKKYSQLIVITGTIYDSNNDGIADLPTPGAFPTHLFRMLIRCENNLWNIDKHHCREASNTRVLAFVIPNQPKEKNCLEPLEFLLLNTARVKDIEFLTGLTFFQDLAWYSENESIRIRTEIAPSLWKL